MGRRRMAMVVVAAVVVLGVPAAVLARGVGGHPGGTDAAVSTSRDAAAPVPRAGLAEGGADDAAAGEAADPAAPGSPPLPDAAAREVVRTAAVTLQVADPAAAARGVRAAVAGAGGFVAEEQVDTTGSWLVLRVPVAGLDRLVDDLAATGTVLARSGRAEDATDQVVDLDSRVASQQASVTRVRALLAQASTIGDVVAVESELARREADLDSLERRLAGLRDRVALSTLTVELRAAAGPSPSAAPPGFGAGLGTGWAGLRVIGVALATAVGFLLPFLPVAAVAAGAVWVLRRRRRERGGPRPEGGV